VPRDHTAVTGASGALRRAAPPTGPRPAAPRTGSRTAAARGALRRCVAAALAAGFALLPTAGTAQAASGQGVQRQEWALKALHADEAWKHTKGRGVTVAVLDTGVFAGHPDLSHNVDKGHDFVRMGAKRGQHQWARHGTAMAGIIAGHGHGRGGKLGIMGVAPQARILPVRVLLEDNDPQRQKARRERGGALAEGIRWAADHGADVINLSLGDDSNSAHPEAREDAAVRYALRKGSVVVASAGNGGQSGDHVSYPAAYPGVIAATAVDRHDARAAFSTRRWYATVAAPGKDVIIADPDKRYYEGWGTSAAAAFVSGSVALVRAAHPNLSPVQIKELMASTAQKTPEGGRSDALGTGVVDPAAAIEMGSNIKPTAERPSQLPYKAEYFGPGPDHSTGWFALIAAVIGAVLTGCAYALYKGFTTADVREAVRRPRRRY
jgi:type VII secretion-associated serine protease mycosin